MAKKLILPVILFLFLAGSCTSEQPSATNPAADTTTNAKPAEPKHSVTVDDHVAPVPKRISDSIYNGEYIERYENGVIRKRGDIAGGVAHGEWLSFYPSGKLWSKGTYVNGLRTGYGVSYYENGQKSSEGYYKDGNFVGVWKFWTEQGELATKDYGDGGK